MGHNLRTYRIPAGALLKAEKTLYGVGRILRIGTYGLVLDHERPFKIKVLWQVETSNVKRPQYAPKLVCSENLEVIILDTEFLTLSLTGHTDQLTAILPEGVELLPW